MLVLLAASQPALAEIRIIPDRIAVAQWPAGRTVEVTTWAINTGDDTAQLARLDVGDDAALAGIDFTPRRLEPGAAEPITLRFVAPGENEMRVSEVRLIESDQTAHDLSVSVGGVHPDVFFERPDRQAGRRLRATPPVVILDASAPGETATGEIWLINTTDEPLQIVRAKGNCGCLKFPGFEPSAIAPHHTLRVSVSMMALGEPGKDAIKYATFLQESDEMPLTIEIRQPIVALAVRKVERFVDAWTKGDATKAAAYLARDARFTQGARHGEDETMPPSDPFGLERLRGWVEWDRELDVKRRLEGLTGSDTTGVVTGTMYEQSDARRARRLAAAVYEVTFTLDDAGDIATIEFAAVDLGGAPLPARTAEGAAGTRRAIDAARANP